MKKFCSLIMSLVLTLSLSTTCFSAELPAVANENDAMMVSAEEVTMFSIQPMSVETLYSNDFYFWPGFEGSFHLNAKRNLKLVFGATADCTIMIYKGNSVIPMKIINLTGDGTARTYTIKNNCSAGDYSFILTTNDQNCFASMRIVATQYT